MENTKTTKNTKGKLEHFRPPLRGLCGEKSASPSDVYVPNIAFSPAHEHPSQNITTTEMPTTFGSD